MSPQLAKLIEAECEYLLASGWILLEEDTWDHHVWNYRPDENPENGWSHSEALKRQKNKDNEY